MHELKENQSGLLKEKATISDVKLDSSKQALI